MYFRKSNSYTLYQQRLTQYHASEIQPEYKSFFPPRYASHKNVQLSVLAVMHATYWLGTVVAQEQ